MRTIADAPSRELALVYVGGLAHLVQVFLPDLLAALTRSQELAATALLADPRADGAKDMVAEIPDALPVLLEQIEVARILLVEWLDSPMYQEIGPVRARLSPAAMSR